MVGVVSVASRAEHLRGGISPMRRAVLEQLQEPASAAAVAARLGVSRQRVAYHVRELEQAGLVQMVEERQRRGCVERIVKVTPGAVVVGTDVIGDPRAVSTANQDRFAADSLLALSARTVNDVAQLGERARVSGRRLVTFAIEADVGFAQPADIERFTNRLAEAVTRLVAEFDTGQRQHRFRVVAGGYPQPNGSAPESALPDGV
jgi:DNA-binding transcriptional ArsR family regulator